METKNTSSTTVLQNYRKQAAPQHINRIPKTSWRLFHFEKHVSKLYQGDFFFGSMASFQAKQIPHPQFTKPGTIPCGPVTDNLQNIPNLQKKVDQITKAMTSISKKFRPNIESTLIVLSI